MGVECSSRPFAFIISSDSGPTQRGGHLALTNISTNWVVGFWAKATMIRAIRLPHANITSFHSFDFT